MANKTLFNTGRQARVKPTDTRNKAGGRAYKLSDAEALCQYVVTSTFNDVYYSTGKEQLDAVTKCVENVEPEVVAKAAVYGAETGRMKDIPAYLLACLAARGEIDLLRKAWPRVIKSPKMLLNFVQIIRSGVTGRRSFGSAVKNLIRQWFDVRRGNQLFVASRGYTNPSLVDVIKMVHPRPNSEEKNALYGYLIGKPYEADLLPPLVKEFEAFKADQSNPMPDIDYRQLTNFNLTDAHWKQIAKNMPWNTTRMNLNLLEKHGVFADNKITEMVANRLRNEQEIQRWNAFPYQLLTTFQNVQGLPQKIKLALQDAMEIATKNVPVLGDRVAVCVDVSGSMSSPVTGQRRDGTSTQTTCRDVGALMASAIARTNPEATIISFATSARVVPGFNPRDSIMTNSQKLSQESRYVGHGTNVSEAMRVINAARKPYDFVVFVGDSQSWMDSNMNSTRTDYGIYSVGSGLAGEWATFKGYSRKGKLAEIVVGPYTTTQMPTSDPSVMNIGGFSDSVFHILGEFAERQDNVRFLDVIESVEL